MRDLFVTTIDGKPSAHPQTLSELLKPPPRHEDDEIRRRVNRAADSPPRCLCGLPLLWETGALCAQCARADANMESLLEKESA